ncbi:MAG: DNA gyrase subunit B [Phycisphaerales bacterium]
MAEKAVKPTPAPPEAAAAPGGQQEAALTVGAVNGNYGAEQIQVLEGLEAVRKRPGMYIGGTGLNALHHMVYEVVDNSIDEAMAGHATFVDVTIQADGSCQVVDDGRGIPIDPMKHEDPNLNGRPAIEVVLTKLHAGGKFQQEGSAYKVSGGLHGVGVSCVNALSEYLDCEVIRDGTVHGIGFERGRVTSPLHTVGKLPAKSKRSRGTSVVFMPDAEIFPDTRFDYLVLANRLRELSFLNPGVTLHLADERVGPDGRVHADTFRADTGLPEYVRHLMTGKSPVSELIYFKREDAPNSLIAEVAFQYHDGYNETVLSFANNINNVDGGTHAQGFKVALTRTINGYAKKSGILKEKDPTPSGEDLREGLVCIVSVKLPNPTFNNQPKEKLLNPEIEGFISAVVAEGLDTWLEEHPGEAKRLCLKGIVAAQAREAARKARELTRRKSALESGSMPAKLRDCKTRNVEESEIFIVEGDSAGGSATQGRNVETQAILPLKGKILNVEKARIDKVLSFEEIRVLIAALRVGIGDDFDISRLRYGKVIIMTDADVDGSHIRTLLLTFFFRQMPDLIRRGHVYIAQPPLYQITRGHGRNKKSSYVLNDRTLDDALIDIGLEHSALIVRDVRSTSEASYDAREVRRIEGHTLRRVLQLLRRMGELTEIAERRGTLFKDLLAQRAHDPAGPQRARHRLPTHKISWRGGEAYAWSEAQALEIITQKHLRLATGAAHGDEAAPHDAPPDAPLAASAVVRELHENRELDRIFEQLESFGLPVTPATYAQLQGETVTGEKVPAMFAWVSTREEAEGESAPHPDEDPEDAQAGAAHPATVGAHAPAPKPATGHVEAPNLPSIIAGLREIGRRGLEVKRFKGLGEMDAEQLWETTMDPTVRTLLRVSWDMGSNADALFTVLMGEEVEPRRKFIEEHALEVKNLDV